MLIFLVLHRKRALWKHIILVCILSYTCGLVFGHITPFLHLSNKLARKGHKISFFVPTRTQSRVQHLNLFPHLTTFVTVVVPNVEALPLGAETTSDVPPPLIPLIASAMDQTGVTLNFFCVTSNPMLSSLILLIGYWLPKLARQLGIKTVYLIVVNLVMKAYIAGKNYEGQETSMPFEKILLESSHGFPDSSIKLHLHETPTLSD